MSPDVRDLRTGPELVERVRQSLLGAPPEQFERFLAGWVETLSVAENRSRLVALLAASPEPEMRQLTVLLAARLPLPFDPRLRPIVRHLLRERQVPEVALLTLAAALLKARQPDIEANEVLAGLVAGLGKTQAVERLRQLEQRTGTLRAIDAYRSRLEDRIKMLCPRCSVELPRPQMMRHLWMEHRLVVVGQSVRDPWRLIEDWLDEYRYDAKQTLLARCRSLAQHADPVSGLMRVQRLFLAHRINDADAIAALREEATLQQASLCPHCYALIFAPADVLVQPLDISEGRIADRGILVSVAEEGVRTRIEIQTPGQTSFVRSEPDRQWTQRGALLILAGPLVVAALVAALARAFTVFSVAPIVLGLLTAAGIVAAIARRMWRPARPSADRSIDYAWLYLVPRLHADAFDADESAFAARLALTSSGRGEAKPRHEELLRLLRVTERAVANSTVSATHLGALFQLAVRDSAEAGVDPAAFLVTQAGRSFEGKLPIVFVEQLLTGLADVGLSVGDRARLRVLLCDRAFEAGCEVRDLVALGKAAPAFGALLGTDQPDYLAQMRLIWSLRPTMPWSRCGPAATAYEIATNVEAGRKHLGRHPALLLAAWDLPGGYICAHGIVFHEVLFTETPTSIEVKVRNFLQGGGFELVLDSQRFWFQSDPGPLLHRLERWFWYYFQVFRGQVAGVYGWPSQIKLDTLLTPRVLKCPECARKVRVRTGEVGIEV